MSLTPEQIKEAMKTDEVKAAIASAVEEAKKPLLEKRDELLGSLREIKDRVSSLEKEKDEIEHQNAVKSGDIEKIKTQLESQNKKIVDGHIETIAKLQGQLDTLVIGEGLTKALVKANVQPGLMDAAKALIKQNFKGEISDSNGTPTALFDGKSVEEFVASWAQTDAGKNFVSASANGGGGSNGANGKGNAGTGNKPTMKRSEFDALAPMQQAQTIKTVTLVD